MHSRYLAILVFLFLSSGLFAQTNLSIGLHSGILVSAFEDQDESYTAIPVGVYFGTAVSDNVEIGAEASIAVKPFEEEVGGITTSISQTIIGLYTRFYFPAASFTPYIRAGAGYYLGSAKFEGGGGLNAEIDFKGALGFNVGAGFGTSSGLYAEFIYHIVERELEKNDFFISEPGGASNWGAYVGFAFSIN